MDGSCLEGTVARTFIAHGMLEEAAEQLRLSMQTFDFGTTCAGYESGVWRYAFVCGGLWHGRGVSTPRQGITSWTNDAFRCGTSTNGRP